MLHLNDFRLRLRRKRFRRALARADVERMLLLGPDPEWSTEALLRSVDSLLGAERLDALERLEPLALHAAPSDRAIFCVIKAYVEAGRSVAQETAHRQHVDLTLPDEFLKWAETWLIFLELSISRNGSFSTKPLGPIIQFWDTEVPPYDVLREMNNWKTLANGVGYLRFDAKTGLEFLEEHFGADEIRLFERAIHPAVQSDLLRLCVLKTKGGIYVDADTRASPKFGTIASSFGPASLWFRTSMAHCRIQNGFLAFERGHPFVEAMLNKTKERLSAGSHGSILAMSGPAMATDTLLEEAQKGNTEGLVGLPISFVHTEILRQFDASYKRDDRNWRVFQRNRRDIKTE